MRSLAPGPGRTLDSIFGQKIPKINPEDALEREKFVISPELIAYLKWLIYTAAFKDPSDGERAQSHADFFTQWVGEVIGKEKGYRQLLYDELKIWYGKHPTTKKRGHGSMEPDLSRMMPGSVITLDEWEIDDEAGAGDGGLGS